MVPAGVPWNLFRREQCAFVLRPDFFPHSAQRTKRDYERGKFLLCVANLWAVRPWFQFANAQIIVWRRLLLHLAVEYDNRHICVAWCRQNNTNSCPRQMRWLLVRYSMTCKINKFNFMSLACSCVLQVFYKYRNSSTQILDFNLNSLDFIFSNFMTPLCGK